MTNLNTVNTQQDQFDLSPELSFKLYALMYKIRAAEHGITTHYHKDYMKTPMHMSMGQEASAAGVISALNGKGDIFSTYRSHATFLSQTEDLEKFFAEMYGKVTGTAEGKSGSMHLAFPEKGHHISSAIVASCLPIAVGAGYANKCQKNGQISTVFFGDGAIDEGVFWESLNAACLYEVPMLFVCEDNGLAVHTSKKQRHGYKSIDDVVNVFDCIFLSDETNDVESIYQTTQKVIQESFSSQKPAFLRIKCHRYLEHVGINEDWHEGYRHKNDYKWWYENDSIKTQRQRLLDIGFGENQIQQAENEIKQAIDDAILKAEQADFCPVDHLYTGVFYEKN